MTSFFVDAAGRPWSLVIDPAAVRRVRALTGVDLGRTAGLRETLADPARVAKVLHAVCEPAAEERGVTRDDFLRALGYGAGADAVAALLAALAEADPDRWEALLTEVRAARRAVERRLRGRRRGRTRRHTDR